MDCGNGLAGGGDQGIDYGALMANAGGLYGVEHWSCVLRMQENNGRCKDMYMHEFTRI